MITIRFILLCMQQIVNCDGHKSGNRNGFFRIFEKLQWNGKVASKHEKSSKMIKWRKTIFNLCPMQYFFSVPVSGAQIHLDSNNYILRDDLFYVTDLFIQSRINVLLVSLFFHESILSINHTKLKCKSCIKCDT